MASSTITEIHEVSTTKYESRPNKIVSWIQGNSYKVVNAAYDYST